jgi:hypothetical protein
MEFKKQLLYLVFMCLNISSSEDAAEVWFELLITRWELSGDDSLTYTLPFIENLELDLDH